MCNCHVTFGELEIPSAAFMPMEIKTKLVNLTTILMYKTPKPTDGQKKVMYVNFEPLADKKHLSLTVCIGPR